MVTNYVGDGQLTYYGVRFVNQVWPGDTLTARAEISAIRDEDGGTVVDLTISTTNQDEKFVLTGNATARIN
jgi:acyl dehydratase